ncbi:MAG TPA: homoserine kinase [Phototrophicaceae bacterium]|nr:homoserine kinase [Phototrophicaceae bacterium]
MAGNTRAEAFAPATVANLGVGFDILGLALQEPGDTVCAEYREEPGAVIIRIEGDGGRLPYEAHKNTACIAAQETLNFLGVSSGAAITIYKDLPLASGLGSSAASAVAAAVAVNGLYGSPLTFADLLPACLEGEAAVSGYHADNVAPCLFGGVTLVMGTAAAQIYQLPIPQNLYLALVTPAVAVPTASARAVLPKEVTLRQMVSQTAAVARLIDALYRSDLEALAVAMELDSVIEPARAHLMPLLTEIRAAAKWAGALGLVISGAGPTLCALCDTEAAAGKVAQAMKAVYDNAGIASVARCTQISSTGAHLL